MTEVNPELFKDVSRNDPCPCGSGQKFKKCHEKTLKLQKVAEKKTRSVQQLVGPNTHAWNFYKLLRMIHEDNLSALFYEFLHEEGPLRKKYPTLEAFLLASDQGEFKLPASDDFDLRRMRVDGPDVILLLNKGIHDPKTASVNLDVIRIRPNEFDASRKLRGANFRGFRIWDIERFERPKGEEVGLADLGYTWEEAWTHPEEARSPVSPTLEAQS